MGVEARIELANPDLGSGGLGVADRSFREYRLTLEVGQVDVVIVDQRQLSDASAREVLQRRASDPADPHEHDVACRQPRLPGAADLGQDNMPGEAVETVGGEGHGHAIPFVRGRGKRVSP